MEGSGGKVDNGTFRQSSAWNKLHSGPMSESCFILIDKFKREEAVSKKASGIQESLDAINVQSEYESLSGLLRMYLGLKTAYEEEKQRLKNEKDRKQEILEHSAQRFI